MAAGAIRTVEEADDFIRGLTLLGTGGGGHAHVGRRYLLQHIESGESLQWVDLAEAPDDAWACTVFGMGSMAPSESLSEAERRRLGYGDADVAFPMTEAVKELREYTGLDIRVIAPFELGATNTSAPLDAAHRLGLSFVDADFAGRAIPELAQTTAAVAGYPLWPAAIADGWGNRLIVKSSPSLAVAERLGKMISIVTKRPDPLVLCAHAGFLMRVGEMKKLVVPGTLTLAASVGRAIRQARERGDDPARAAAGALDGWVLFAGRVARKEWENREGYMYGTTFVEGSGAFEGHTFKVWYQNENHIAWLDDAPYVTSPDLIMLLETASGEPLTNTAVAEGQQVAVIGARASHHYRTEAGLAALGPAHFGFDLPYRPIETVVEG